MPEHLTNTGHIYKINQMPLPWQALILITLQLRHSPGRKYVNSKLTEPLIQPCEENIAKLMGLYMSLQLHTCLHRMA